MWLAQHHREIADVLSLYGIVPHFEPTNGGHVRISWQAGRKKQCIIVAKTPSDWRAARNNAARVRRKLKAAGVTKIAPSKREPEKRVAVAAPPQPKSKPTIEVLEARITRLERDMQMLLDRLTTPATPQVADTSKTPPASHQAKTSRKRGRTRASWLWRALRYDTFLTIGDVAAAAGKAKGDTAVALSFWKKLGFVEHRKDLGGWRKTPKVEELDRVRNGKAA